MRTKLTITAIAAAILIFAPLSPIRKVSAALAVTQDSRCQHDGCHTMMYGYGWSYTFEFVAENQACEIAQHKCTDNGNMTSFCTIYETGIEYGHYYAKARACCYQCIASATVSITVDMEIFRKKPQGGSIAGNKYF